MVVDAFGPRVLKGYLIVGASYFDRSSSVNGLFAFRKLSYKTVTFGFT